MKPVSDRCDQEECYVAVRSSEVKKPIDGLAMVKCGTIVDDTVSNSNWYHEDSIVLAQLHLRVVVVDQHSQQRHRVNDSGKPNSVGICCNLSPRNIMPIQQWPIQGHPHNIAQE